MRVISVFALMLLIAISVCVSAQKPEDITRKLWDTAYAGPATKKTTSRRRAYRNATPNVPVENVAPDTVVGVTIWRLRPASRSDSGERLIVHEDNSVNEWIPERISATTRLVQGD